MYIRIEIFVMFNIFLLLKKCHKCNYVALNNTNIILHILNNHSTIKERENGLKNYCKYCDYGTLAKSLYDNHLETKKHKMMLKLIERMSE